MGRSSRSDILKVSVSMCIAMSVVEEEVEESREKKSSPN